MPTASLKRAAHTTAADTPQAVDVFMARLQHPCIAGIQALRETIADADPAIGEGIKWNAPSFRTTEYFATMNLRAKTGVDLILHLGAKARELPAGGVVIDDPTGALTWLAKDRAIIRYAGLAEIEGHRAALQVLVRQWIRYVG